MRWVGRRDGSQGSCLEGSESLGARASVNVESGAFNLL